MLMLLSRKRLFPTTMNPPAVDGYTPAPQTFGIKKTHSQLQLDLSPEVRGVFIVLCGMMFPVLIMNILISVLSARGPKPPEEFLGSFSMLTDRLEVEGAVAQFDPTASELVASGLADLFFPWEARRRDGSVWVSGTGSFLVLVRHGLSWCTGGTGCTGVRLFALP